VFGFRSLRKELIEAAWPDQAARDDFVQRAVSSGPADVAKLIPSLLPESGVSMDLRKRRLGAFVAIVKSSPDQSLFAPMFKAALGGDEALRRVFFPLLVKTSDRKAPLDLVRSLQSSDPDIRHFTAQVLTKVGGRKTLQAVAGLLRKQGWSSRVEAMEVAMEIGGHHAIESIAPVVRIGTLEDKLAALSLLGNERYVKSGRRAAMAAVEPALGDTKLRVVGAAVKAYGVVAPEDAFFDAVGPFLRSPDRRLQRATLQALVSFATPRTMKELSIVWRTGDNAVRETILPVLEAIGDDSALPLLVKALDDQSLPIRTRALEVVVTLGRARRVDVSRMLMWLLRSESLNVRRQAVEIVRQVGDPLGELWPRLLRLLRDEDWWVRERVVEALVEIAGSDLTRHVVAYLEDESDVVRRYAVEVLMRIRDPRSLGALVRVARTDTDWWVRERAIECMGEIGDKKVIPHLAKLCEEDSTLIPSTITALGSIGSTAGLTFLARVLRMEDPDLRLDALKVLANIGDRRVAPYVEPLAIDPDARVRALAKNVLLGWQTRFEGDEHEAEVEKRLHGLERLLFHMVKQGGDDMFVVSGRPVFMKKLGEMVQMTERSMTAEQVESTLRSLLSRAQADRFDELDDVDLSMAVKSVDLRFRVNVHRQIDGMAAVFRRIGQELHDLETLGLPPLLADLCDLPDGLVLIGGPTGSGKSTTLAAMIHHINQRHGKHIITIEDPIEVVHANIQGLINQREVGTHTLSFARALRSTLREDPDVILVGEMRDLDTIAFAISAAETGHLVLATVHTVSADTSVDRLIDAFPPGAQQQVRAMLSQTLRAVVCQQLLRSPDGLTRVPAVEILLNTDAVANHIRKGQCYQLPSVIATSREIGMQSMDNELMRLVGAGLAEPLDAYMKAIQKKNFEALLATDAVVAAAEGRAMLRRSTTPSARVPEAPEHSTHPLPSATDAPWDG